MSAPQEPRSFYLNNVCTYLDRFTSRANCMRDASRTLRLAFRKLPTVKGDEKGLIDFMDRLKEMEKVFFNRDVLDEDVADLDQEQQRKVDTVADIFTELGNDLSKNVDSGGSKLRSFIRVQGPSDRTMKQYIMQIDDLFEFDKEFEKKKTGDSASEDTGNEYFFELINEFRNAEVDAKVFTAHNVMEGTCRGRIVNSGNGSTFRITDTGFSHNKIVTASRGTYEITSEGSTVETQEIVRHSQTLGGKPKTRGLDQGTRIHTIHQLNATTST